MKNLMAQATLKLKTLWLKPIDIEHLIAQAPCNEKSYGSSPLQ